MPGPEQGGPTPEEIDRKESLMETDEEDAEEEYFKEEDGEFFKKYSGESEE